MNAMPPESVDAIVTDPPYGLGFMGKKWDGLPPSLEWAEACYRVLKPGGHIAAFGGTRTWHRLAVAIEDAGFEMRDSLAWLYGSGFPKSHDVGKAIDRMNGRDMPTRYALARHIREVRESAGFTRADVAAWFPQYREVTANWERCDESGNRVPTPSDWDVLRERLSVSDEWLPLIHRVEAERTKVGQRNGTDLEYAPGEGRRRDATVLDITAPATPEAVQWNGWGTALKPAFEPIVLARKPFPGTVARNVLEHGTGAINVDACRIAGEVPSVPQPDFKHVNGAVTRLDAHARNGQMSSAPSGRWPANVLLDQHAAAWVDEQSGTLHTQDPATRASKSKRAGVTRMGTGRSIEYDDRDGPSGASRFFYSAKAPKAERPNVDGVQHPTVKPLAIMRWLIRLVTPPGGTVLDPFAGSGTTIEAALIEGFTPVGIEMETDYLPLIQHRIERQQA